MFDAVAGFGPLQKYLDDPTVEEIWINEPGRGVRRPARRSRADHHDAHRRRGPRPGRADAEVLRPPGRPVAPRSSTRCCPTAAGCTSVIPDITRAALVGRTSASSWCRATHLDDLVALGTLTAQAARFLEAAVAAGLNILVAGGTQAGKTTLLNCLVAAIPARERVITCEEVFELKIRAARRGGDADPAAQPRGHRRDPAAPPGQGGAADAARPDHRRRGPAGGVPRPADRAELRAARACAPSTPTPPARRSPRCARCRCWPARTSATRSSCRPSPAASTSSCTSAIERDGRRAVREIVAIPGRVEGDVVETRRLFATTRRPAGARRRLAAAPRALRSAPASTWPRCSSPSGIEALADGRARRAAVRARAVPDLAVVRAARAAPSRARHAPRPGRGAARAGRHRVR